MIFKNYLKGFKMRRIGLGSCFFLVVAMLVGCGDSDTVQMPDNPVPMPADILESETVNNASEQIKP